jgi:hypothetical protein
MAGKPVLRKLEKWIKDRGGDRWVLDQIADGVAVGKIAAQVDLPGHGAISRPLLYEWRNRSEDRKQGWAAAMKDAAHAHAEKAGECWEDLPEDPTTGQVQKARGMSEYRRWLAGHRNEEYAAQKQGAGLVVNVGTLHLDALRQAGHVTPAVDRRRLEAAAEVIDVEVEVEVEP